MKKVLPLLFIILSINLYFLTAPIPVDLQDCPYCYGKDICNKLENGINYRQLTVTERLHNSINAKNVFYAYLGDEKVVLKKLAHNYELNILTSLICKNHNLPPNCELNLIKDTQDYYKHIVKLITTADVDVVKNFKVCSNHEADLFLSALADFNQDLKGNERLISIWTILQMNVEPLILYILNKKNNKWPVPKYYGACGKIIIESYNGLMLTKFADLSWPQRAYLAHQILRSALKFTEGDEYFRYYLTDVSPDNIVVDPQLKITFIDLENVVVVSKLFNKSSTVHRSKDWDENSDFSYSEEHLCGSSVSDHNIYAICKLILSRNAPYPMKTGGLLHHPPTDKGSKYNLVLANIELCADPNQNVDRFLISRKIISDLEALHSSVKLN